jgi:hypothetical protein
MFEGNRGFWGDCAAGANLKVSLHGHAGAIGLELGLVTAFTMGPCTIDAVVIWVPAKPRNLRVSFPPVGSQIPMAKLRVSAISPRAPSLPARQSRFRGGRETLLKVCFRFGSGLGSELVPGGSVP